MKEDIETENEVIEKESFFSKTMDITKVKITMKSVFFIGTWLFLWFFYGSVLFQLQEQSLWIFEPIEKFKQLLLPSDILTYISRFCLTIFAVPWLGSLLLAVILSLTEFFSEIIFRPKARLFWISYIPSLILLYFICSQDYMIYYERENSIIFKVLLITIVTIGLISLIVRFLFRDVKKPESSITVGSCSLAILLIIAAMYGAFLYGSRDDGFIELAQIKYYMTQKKWSKVAKIAESTDKPSRAIAAYHAIALSQMGQIGDRLFRVPHDFPKASIDTKLLKITTGGILYTPDLQFYAGLVMSSYHFAMEQLVMCGRYKYYIKLMAKIAVANRESELADKLIEIISRMPFEKKYAARLKYLNSHPDELKKDSEFASVSELIPTHDAFEESFNNPLVIDYYNRIPGNNSPRMLDLTLASCLYTKNIDGFATKYAPLAKRQTVPRYFQEAIALMAIGTNDLNLVKKYHVSKEIVKLVNDFYNEAGTHSNEKDHGKSAMEAKYKGTYMYYLFYENQRN